MYLCSYFYAALHRIMPALLLDPSGLWIGRLEEITFSNNAAFVHSVFKLKSFNVSF